ncbi:hypothetical protein DIY07_09575 [Streptococcus iniae]|uniref:Uncharacterized protein n=1 Tax=Streptococcus iniae TaxID=1346 RepID=A0A3L8GD83_STRIN|nr:hypothetical protein [Streptococcus iniae]RLU51748.1 hypothetical protein DIY09_09470 [Streptococcus iniae]RLU54871.1 hypothetical protein DIY07_09575 [Streptococcus iniae]
MINEEHINQTNSSKSRRQKSTQERLDDKIKQLEKAQENQEALQKKIRMLKDDIAILEGKRQQEIMADYGIDLQGLEAILATHKDELGGEG